VRKYRGDLATRIGGAAVRRPAADTIENPLRGLGIARHASTLRCAFAALTKSYGLI
jgi:hypothetical protein